MFTEISSLLIYNHISTNPFGHPEV
jgi:hypothetical protein